MQRTLRFIAILCRFLVHCDVRLGRRVFTFLKVHLQHVGVPNPERKSCHNVSKERVRQATSSHLFPWADMAR